MNIGCYATMNNHLMVIFTTGFHDAIGDAISISITPKHLQGLGLIQKSVDDTAHDINFLFSMAMDKVRSGCGSVAWYIGVFGTENQSGKYCSGIEF